MDEALRLLNEYLTAEQGILDNIDTVQAPSGEWDEYNMEFNEQQAIVTTVETIIYRFENQPKAT